MRYSGGEALVRCLINEGVKYVFGVPGAQLLPFLDAIYLNDEIEFIMTRHEQAAAHMADAWYRLTNQIGVCVGTVGPGAADLVPGVYAAWADSIPILVITAQNQSWKSYPDHGSMQALDQYMLFKSITKWNAVVNNIARIPELVQRAIRTALSDKPGPVHLDFPSDILFGEYSFAEDAFQRPERYRAITPPSGDPDLITMAAKMLTEAEMPLIHAGSGVLRSRAHEELIMLAEYLSAPVTTSFSARGVIPEDHPLCLLPGSFGAIAAQNSADVVLLVGCRLGDLDFWGRPPGWGDLNVQKVIQIDISGEMIALNRPVNLAIIGDAKSVLRALVREVKKLSRRKSRDLSEYQQLVREWLRGFEKIVLSSSKSIHPLRVVKEVREFFPRDAITCIDGGNTAVWASYLNRIYEPGTLLWAADSGHLGSGLPYAIAAKLAKPEKHVYLLTGDGAFMLNIQELETARRLNTNIIVIVLNDLSWGMIKGSQKLMFDSRFIGVDFSDVEYDRLAESMGCLGIRVERVEDIKPALKKAIKSGLPAVIDVRVDREAHLTPPDLETLAALWLEGCEPPKRESSLISQRPSIPMRAY